jgi:hypothetical protein
LAALVGGPRWRTSLADLVGDVGLWRCGIEPRLIGTLRCEDRQVADRVRRSPAVGAFWLALFDWRRNLAVRLGGVSWRTCLADQLGGPLWRCRLWRCGIERRLIGTLRCEDRQGPGGVSWSVTVGALWLALSAGGGTWRCQLAEQLGGTTWRTSLAVSPVAVRDWAATDRHASMRGSAGSRWGELVTDSWRSLVGAL